jgi:ribonuclease BN (tRNA processing enzyme)
MKLMVLGAGTTLPAPSRSPSCHLLRIGDQAVVFDMGAGSLARLSAAGMDYRDIDTVFISHFHPDHVLDVVMLLQAANATPGWSRTQPLSIIGCRGLEEFLTQLLLIFRGAQPQSYRLEVVELDVGRHTVAGLDVEVVLTGHTSNSLAFRVEAAGKVFVYSGDAADVAELAHLANGADIFLCECSFPRGYHTDDHLTSETAARIANVASAKHLVLTHTYPDTQSEQTLAEARAVFSGRLTVAVDGTVIEG